MAGAKDKTVVLEPDYPALLRWWVAAYRQGDWERGAIAPMISFLELVRYVHATAPQELERVIQELRDKEQRLMPSPRWNGPRGAMVGHDVRIPPV